MDKSKKIVLTGDRPSGPLHLGHYLGSLKSRLELQGTCEQLIMIADAQALTDNAANPEKVRQNVLEVACDYLAVGLDPKQNIFFIQSLVPELFELTLYYLNLVTWNRLKHNPTVKQEITQKNFGDSVPAGFMTYPISQAADISAFKANCVPVGQDQMPMIEQTNEIVRKFNTTYNCNVLVKAEGMITKFSRLPGIDGDAKMSKSLGNCIYLGEESSSLKKKIRKIPGDPNHTEIDAPGDPDKALSFTYLRAFCQDKEKLQELETHYRNGGLGDGTVKQYLLEALEEFLTPIRKRRAEFASDPAEVMRIFKEGSLQAREKAAATLSEVRAAMHLNY